MSCDYQKTPFSDVKLIISKIITTASPHNWNLIPDDLFQLAVSAAINPKWQKIDWWDQFEYGFIAVPDIDFNNLLFGGFNASSERMLIITDECFSDKMAYEINYSDFAVFIDVIYPEIHEMDFFQPSDFIFIFPESSIIVMLHQEGYYYTIRC